MGAEHYPPGEEIETRQVRRERRKQKKHDKMLHHGRSLTRVYRNAILKRLKRS